MVANPLLRVGGMRTPMQCVHCMGVRRLYASFPFTTPQPRPTTLGDAKLAPSSSLWSPPHGGAAAPAYPSLPWPPSDTGKGRPGKGDDEKLLVLSQRSHQSQFETHEVRKLYVFEVSLTTR